jgi:hypothetical protein
MQLAEHSRSVSVLTHVCWILTYARIDSVLAMHCGEICRLLIEIRERFIQKHDCLDLQMVSLLYRMTEVALDQVASWINNQECFECVLGFACNSASSISTIGIQTLMVLHKNVTLSSRLRNWIPQVSQSCSCDSPQLWSLFVCLFGCQLLKDPVGHFDPMMNWWKNLYREETLTSSAIYAWSFLIHCIFEHAKNPLKKSHVVLMLNPIKDVLNHLNAKTQKSHLVPCLYVLSLFVQNCLSFETSDNRAAFDIVCVYVCPLLSNLNTDIDHFLLGFNRTHEWYRVHSSSCVKPQVWSLTLPAIVLYFNKYSDPSICIKFLKLAVHGLSDFDFKQFLESLRSNQTHSLAFVQLFLTSIEHRRELVDVFLDFLSKLDEDTCYLASLNLDLDTAIYRDDTSGYKEKHTIMEPSKTVILAWVLKRLL